MFPILWRYLLKIYFKVFFLSICAFISVLIVSRFKEIARFAALSGHWAKTGLFTLYQVPFILPFAIPVSTLAAAFLLFQRLSRTSEIAALRSSGFSLRALLAPLLFSSLLLSFAHFCICASAAPYCFNASKILLYKETSKNPLLLLQRQNLIKIKGAYLRINVEKEGQAANQFMLISYNERNQRLHLLSAEELQLAQGKLHCLNASFLSYLHSKNKNTFDPLFIENERTMETDAPLLSSLLKKYTPKLDVKGLPFRLLRLRAAEEGKQASGAWVEMLGRCSLTLSVFTFTLLGSAFGLHQNRSSSKKRSGAVFLLATTALMGYLGLKACKTALPLAFCAAFIPHFFIAASSLWQLRLHAKGSQ